MYTIMHHCNNFDTRHLYGLKKEVQSFDVERRCEFTKQAAETCKSVSFKSHYLSKIKRYLDTDMTKLYKAYI